ncbi:MAG: AHH domain-containing protein [Lachnospiraceae bacterium]|nr:AHH domain-containing protein [Lachnospiraceae bacterium]
MYARIVKLCIITIFLLFLLYGIKPILLIFSGSNKKIRSKIKIQLAQRWIRVLVGEAADPLFCGRLRWIEQQQVKGNHRLTLELVSGTSLLDQKRKSHSYQDIAMSYGKLLDQAARQAGGMVLYPAGLEDIAIGFPKIQYEETDWEFLKRMASHLGLSLYPQVEQPRAGLWVGLPQAEGAKAFDWRHYRIVWDSRYDELGGEKAGNSRDRFISYEVESEGSYGCGQEVTFQGKGLTICSKSCRSEGGELLFTYRLGYPEWAGQRRLTHKKLSGLSLLGEVISREGERLKLKLDIDREHSDWKQEKAYAFLWCPPTGNLMYMMPAQGSRVSLYFPRGEEEGAVAVNCIRREGEAQGRSYRERGLKTEGKELKLYPDCMGVESISGKVMLDDLEGIRISGDKALQIIARGKIRIEGKGVQVEGGKEGIRLNHGGVEERGEEILVAATAQLHLLSRQGEAMWVSLGEKSSLLGYEVEDYSAEGFRFKDDPVQENYDWDAYWSRVAGALVIVGGVTLIAGTGAGILAAGGWAVNATVVMGSAAAGGIIAVGGLAAMDAMSGRLSSAQEYIREALVGSIIGALTGATAQLPTKRLGIVGKNVAEFAIGSGESAAEQQLRKGEIDFREAIGCGILNLILSGVLDNLSREQGVRVRGGEGRVIFFEDELPPEEAERLINFLKNDRKRINYQDIWDIRNSSKVIESGTSSSKGGSGGRLIPGTEGIVTGGDSTKLGKNMMESMGLPRGTNWTGHQAQHIIPAEMANHPVLQRMGMDLDDASNGLFLRTPADDISAMSRHRGYHSTYNEFVRTQLDGMDINQSVDVLQKQVYDLQQNLKYLQRSGLLYIQVKVQL